VEKPARVPSPGGERRRWQHRAWTVETLNQQGLSRAGLNQDSLKVGEALSMTVCVKKDGSRSAVTDAIDTPGGTALVRVGGC
jgi:hypothetical protein